MHYESYPFIRRVISPAECIGRMFHKGWRCAIYTFEPAIFPYERRARLEGGGGGRKRKYSNSRSKYELAPGGALSSGTRGRTPGEPVALFFERPQKRLEGSGNQHEGRKRRDERSHPPSLSALFLPFSAVVDVVRH